MNAKSAGPPWRYRLLLLLLAPAIIIHLIWRSRRDGGDQFRRQRLGFGLPKITENCLWIHAASVGEVITATPLIRSLQRHYPDYPLLLTTTTPTGLSTLKRLHNDNATLAYLPIDFNWAVKRFYRQTRIQCGIIIETEIWPNLYHHAAAPLAIVNGRLSSRTLNAATGWASRIYRRTIKIPDLIATRSDTDRDAFIRIGANAETTRVVGNLKFSGALATREPLAALSPRRYCLLASTHDNEEEQLTRIWLEQGRHELLVIAPRHPDRSKAIQQTLSALSDKLAVRSLDQAINDQTRIYIADTFGELMQWYAHADAVFIGGSLIQRGGHNMLEAASVGKCAVCGPHTFNFADEVTALQTENAILTGANASVCIDHLLSLLDDQELARNLGLAAKNVVSNHAGVAEKYLEHLKPLLRQP